MSLPCGRVDSWNRQQLAVSLMLGTWRGSTSIQLALTVLQEKHHPRGRCCFCDFFYSFCEHRGYDSQKGVCKSPLNEEPSNLSHGRAEPQLRHRLLWMEATQWPWPLTTVPSRRTSCSSPSSFSPCRHGGCSQMPTSGSGGRVPSLPGWKLMLSWFLCGKGGGTGRASPQGLCWVCHSFLIWLCIAQSLTVDRFFFSLFAEIQSKMYLLSS